MTFWFNNFGVEICGLIPIGLGVRLGVCGLWSTMIGMWDGCGAHWGSQRGFYTTYILFWPNTLPELVIIYLTRIGKTRLINCMNTSKCTKAQNIYQCDPRLYWGSQLWFYIGRSTLPTFNRLNSYFLSTVIILHSQRPELSILGTICSSFRRKKNTWQNTGWGMEHIIPSGALVSRI